MDALAKLRRQQYRTVGRHSAVKICSWTKQSIRGNGVCYKQQFYGIRSHLCVQMTPALGYCHNRCVFCWRSLEYNKGTLMQEPDAPEAIIRGCLAGQRELLTGFGGNENADKARLDAAMKPAHFAISLAGEPTLYPRLGELIQKLHGMGNTTFLVTNGMEPDSLKEPNPTQLYLSVDAPNSRLFEKIDRCTEPDGWVRLQKSLALFPIIGKKTRTCLRFTLIRGLNMADVPGWAEKITVAQPMFCELKAYMHVGESKKRLAGHHMPLHSEVMEFARDVAAASGYRVIDEHPRSRAVLLMREDSKDRVMVFAR